MIAAIVPAAGLSTRMGGPVPKPLLSWADHTVIEQVVATLLAAQVDQVVVITGHRRAELEKKLADPAYAKREPRSLRSGQASSGIAPSEVRGVRCVYNPAHQGGEMLSSIQAGLKALPDGCQGALVALADQPQMERAVVAGVLAAYRERGCQDIVIPSYQRRRGHPILLPPWLWPHVLALGDGQSLRDAINQHAARIHYLMVDTPTVLADLDTWQQYEDALTGDAHGEARAPSQGDRDVAEAGSGDHEQTT